MIEIRCIRENLRESLSDHFPNPSTRQMAYISRIVLVLGDDKGSPDLDVGIAMFNLGVNVIIVTQAEIDADLKAESLSASQASIPHTPEEDEAWRVLESQRAREGQEDHAARRASIKAGGSGYYARTADDVDLADYASRADAAQRAQATDRPMGMSEDFRYADQAEVARVDKAMRAARATVPEGAKHVATVHDAEYYEVDNTNTAEVGTFTDGPEERYSVGARFRDNGSRLVEVCDRLRPGTALAHAAGEESAQLIVDALNAWEASQ